MYFYMAYSFYMKDFAYLAILFDLYPIFYYVWLWSGILAFFLDFCRVGLFDIYLMLPFLESG